MFEPNANSSELVHRVAERMKSGQHPGYEGNLTFEADDGVYSFLKFETRWMLNFLEVLKSLDFPPISLSATGGGAFKVFAARCAEMYPDTSLHSLVQFSPAFQRTIGATIEPCDEMTSLVRGFRFCFEVRASCAARPGLQPTMRHSQTQEQEAFTYNQHSSNDPAWKKEGMLPGSADDGVLLVNIGSGVSLLKLQAGHAAEEPNARRWRIPNLGSVERISGCSVGGATFLGLSRLLTRAESFDEAVSLAGMGDNSRIAMLVKDIYGGEYSRLGLPGDVVAADFGKMSTVEEVVITDSNGKPVGHLPPPAVESSTPSREEYPPTDIHGHVGQLPRSRSVAGSTLSRSHIVSEADLTRGLLVLVLNNIAQVAFMNAQAHGLKQIFFTGGFLREGVMMNVLTSALKFWSGGSMQAGFLKHNTYFGAMGAMLEARSKASP